ncbi:DHHC palmitoyltransferase-domain-containing protein [Geopyxis carbonaria]|nr:DHHC palmitoyltransferase-domain-containing protein [Geopyxis carbonaria]
MNLWVAYFMPLIMVGLVGYGTWVFAVLVCVKHILIERKNTRTAIALLIIYFVLFSLLAIAYFRIVLTVNFNPGYIPKGPKSEGFPEKGPRDDEGEEDVEIGLGGGQSVPEIPLADQHRDAEPLDLRPTTVTRIPTDASLSEVLASGPPAPGDPNVPGHEPPSDTFSRSQVSKPATSPGYGVKQPMKFDMEGLRKFLNKDVFVCQNGGLPRWCDKCRCWKPDRSHHCSEIERCVWKMDHFCPWQVIMNSFRVGGVVAETSYRYFYQVVFWGLFYCLFVMISMAIYINKRSKDGDGLDSTWMAAVVLVAVFGFFCAGMVYSTTQFIARNQSTIDALTADTKVYQLAIRDPNPPPQPDHSVPRLPGDTRVWLPPAELAPGEQQTCFVITKTAAGENPWFLDSTMDNFREALGGGILSWFLPWGIPKPGTTGGERGFYKWNEAIISRLKKEAGIAAYHEK